MQNRLREQTSPYLLQHADNPVHWQPWDPQALDLAVQLDKPILLSIGYSACHWCHVMAHESFDDPDIAAVMNEHFINIKVDREERPDLDQIYQLAHQMLTQRNGGWPLTMFLTPSHMPFFGGTYFPPKPAHGLPGFAQLLERVAAFYHEQREQLDEQNASLMQVFRDSSPQPEGEFELTAAPLHGASRALLGVFDAQKGGFGQAPKFPQTPCLERLLRTWRRSAFEPKPDLQSLFAATQTLTQMARGGLYDQLGGGFFRYAVDDAWRIPHFEKMLNDSALLLALYSEAWRATGEGLFGRVAHETADWMLREMRSARGGFFTALDADSDGREGAFYTWDAEDVRIALADNELDYTVFAKRFGLDHDANFEGTWHLYLNRSIDQLSNELDQTPADLRNQLTAARALLFDQRHQRQAPFCDTKSLTASNALAIRGLALASRHLERDDLGQAAADALDFLRATHWQDGRLFASSSDGSPSLGGYLNDYAFLLDAVLELLQLNWRSSWLHFAVELADAMLEQFYDTLDGGFFFTADDHETLIHRMKPFADEAIPNGNGVAAKALNRLGHMLADTRYLEAAERTIRLAWSTINSVPHGHCTLLDALDEHLTPVTCVIVRAPKSELAQWLPVVQSTYAPGRLCFGIPDDADNLPEAIGVRVARDGGVAYICEGTHCSAPITSPATLAQAVKKLG